MNKIEAAAIAAAELDFQDGGLSKADWLALTSCVRAGISVGPAADALVSVGRKALCESWGIDESLWHLDSTRWFRRYNCAWAAYIEQILSRLEDGL